MLPTAEFKPGRGNIEVLFGDTGFPSICGTDPIRFRSVEVLKCTVVFSTLKISRQCGSGTILLGIGYRLVNFEIVYIKEVLYPQLIFNEFGRSSNIQMVAHSVFRTLLPNTISPSIRSLW